MSPPWFSCVLLLLLACAAGPRASLAQITDVVVVEPYKTSTEEGAPAPALIATVDAQGNVQQRIISPQDVKAALSDIFNIATAPSPAGQPCPSVCLAALACRQSVDQLCEVSGGTFCMTSQLCPMPRICSVCDLLP